MKYAIFIGCQIPARVEQYESASRAVLKKLGVGLVDFRDFNCCGYPMRNMDLKAFLLSAAGNMALAEKAGLDLLALCKCCFGTFKEAQHLLRENKDLKEEINRMLALKGLKYDDRTNVKHLLSVLYHDVGIDTIKANVSRSFKGLQIATHYGCHALRPSRITQFDDPVAPTLFDRLVEVTGAKSIDWVSRLECCGAPLMGINDDLSKNLTKVKLENSSEAGAHCLCTACPYCQQQFDGVQKRMISQNGNGPGLPSILYPQLIGLCMGIEGAQLGLDANQIDPSGITSYFAEE
ncbi:CoB--CoM heterodisulfide reductase iron-sulfur subunit B family protein [Thermodesulfobacteriota bacterium]